MQMSSLAGYVACMPGIYFKGDFLFTNLSDATSSAFSKLFSQLIQIDK